MPDLSLIVAHITDTHFGHDAGRAVDRIRRVLDALMRMDPRPDVLVHSGDVTDHGHPAEYDEAVKELSAWDGPMVISPGNHDVRLPFVDAFCDGPSARATCARTVKGVRFLMLDSLIDETEGGRQDAGLLGSDQLAWLDEQLTADVSPTFVGLHHPPVELGISLMDPIMLGDAAGLAAVIERHPHVRAVLCGHAHTMGTSTFAGRPLLVGGGTVSTVTLDQEDLPIVWYDAPASYAIHFLHPDGRVTSHWRALA